MLLLVLATSPGRADDRETEMFNAGYEYLFSFKPDKAADTFRAFLREFPESSARDAAMFWLGKTLISLRSYAEAEQTFLAIKKEFPESPFLAFIDSEMVDIEKSRSSVPVKESKETAQALKSLQPAFEPATSDNDKKIAQLMEERNRIQGLLEESKKTAMERQLRISDLEAKESLLKTRVADTEAQLLKAGVAEKTLLEIKDEKERLSSEAEKLRAEKNRAEKERDEARQQLRAPDQQQSSAASLMLKISELEHQVWQKETELAQAKEVQEKLRLQAEQERKTSHHLRAEITTLQRTDRELADSARVQEEASTEARKYRDRIDRLQADNRDLSGRIENMEHQAEQRIKDMKILTSYLTKLMFAKKEEPKKQTATAPSSEVETLKSALTEERKLSAELRDKVTTTETRADDLEKQVITLKAKEKPAHIPAPELENLKTELKEEKKRSGDLLEKIAKAENREAELKQELTFLREKPAFTPSPELENLRTELNEEKRRSADLKNKVEAAENREADIRRQLAALKEQGLVQVKQQETKQPAEPAPVLTATITVGETSYTLPKVISTLSASGRAIEKLGIPLPVWRTGDPLEDFINEQLLAGEAERSGAMPDRIKYQETTERFKLSTDEADYVRKFMMIGEVIDKNFTSDKVNLFIETLAVNYRRGDAPIKTVLAADLQNDARSGKSFAEIQRMYGDSVKFARLTIDDFKKRYEGKSEISKKLNFLSEETVVMWSEKGYMLIKPVTVHRKFDPFAELGKEERKRLRSFLSGYIAELKQRL